MKCQFLKNTREGASQLQSSLRLLVPKTTKCIKLTFQIILYQAYPQTMIMLSIWVNIDLIIITDWLNIGVPNEYVYEEEETERDEWVVDLSDTRRQSID